MGYHLDKKYKYDTTDETPAIATPYYFMNFFIFSVFYIESSLFV